MINKILCFLGFHYHPEPIPYKCWRCGKVFDEETNNRVNPPTTVTKKTMKKIPMELELRDDRLILHYSSFQGVKMEVDITGVWHFFKDYQEFLKEPK